MVGDLRLEAGDIVPSSSGVLRTLRVQSVETEELAVGSASCFRWSEGWCEIL